MMSSVRIVGLLILGKIILTDIEDEKHALNGLHAPDEELICFNLSRVFKFMPKEGPRSGGLFIGLD